MKNHEAQAIIDQHAAAIIAAITDQGVLVANLVACGALNSKEFRKGCVARLTVFLADDKPGWRNKDNSAGRRAIKRDVKAALAAAGAGIWTVRVAAGYSCLTEEGGAVVRRDDQGNVIGIHA